MKKRRTKVGLHPVMFFLIFCVVTVILSGILRLFNVQVAFNKVSSVTGELQVTSEAVNSLLSIGGIKHIFTTTASGFANYAVLSNLIIILLGIGIMDKSGFLKTFTMVITKNAKKKTVTFFLVLIAIISSIIGDLSYVITIPLGALIFLYAKRNPMIGIISSYAALTCGSALSLVLTSVDSNLLSMTLKNAYVFDSTYTISPFGYIIVMAILIVLLALIISNITENYVAKKLPKYEFIEEEVEEDLVVTKRKMRGLVLALGVGFIYVLFFIYGIIPGLPLSGSLLDNSQALYIDKLFSYNAFLYDGFVFIVCVLFVLLGLNYGLGAKTIKNNNEYSESLGYSLNGIGKILVLIFASASFVNLYKYTNIGNYVAGLFTSIISNSNFSSFALIILLFISSMIVTIVVPNPINAWNIMSGVVPALMQVGVTPEFSQLVFRLGSSVTLALTPIFAYYIVYLAYLSNYNQSEKPITFMEAFKYQLPYVIAAFVFYLVVIILLFVLDLPLGIGTSTIL